MDIPYSTIFVGLLLAYLVYSVWARLDGRYPIVAALVLLVVTAVVDAAGNADAANSLAEYVFFLLAGGVVLLVIEQVRARPAAPSAPASGSPGAKGIPAEATDEGEGTADQTLHGLEQQPVSLVDRPGGENESHEDGGETKPEDRQDPPRESGRQDPQHDPDRDRGSHEGRDEVPTKRMDASEKPEFDQG